MLGYCHVSTNSKRWGSPFPLTYSGDKVFFEAVIEFEEETFDFGEIKQGEKVVHTFWFKNTGTADLLIAEVVPSCGCTIPTYDKNPIAPDEKGKIKVRFNSSGRNGMQYKTIKVNSNAENGNITLSFKATIVEKE